MQLVGEFQAVVDIYGFAGYVLVRTFVFDAFADTGGDVGAEQGGQLFLGFDGFVMARHRRSPGFRLRER
ncbi:hypothetical protein FQZ97_1278140 [compost metagenome]